MTTANRSSRDRDQERQEQDQLAGQIGKRVLAALGKPPDVRDVQVKRLWANQYRVNVIVGPDATRPRVAHSFFLTADSDGTVVSSVPPIYRLYDSPAGTADR